MWTALSLSKHSFWYICNKQIGTSTLFWTEVKWVQFHRS